MYAQRVAVRYLDGTEAEVTLTQWSIGQFGLWAARQGLKADMSNPGLLAITMLRFQTWAELHRAPKAGAARPSFDTWDATVAEVEPEGSAEVDPTPPAVSGD